MDQPDMSREEIRSTAVWSKSGSQHNGSSILQQDVVYYPLEERHELCYSQWVAGYVFLDNVSRKQLFGYCGESMVDR